MSAQHIILLPAGDDTRQVPYGHCNLIDLSHSQQAHIDCLLDDIMRIERPDYEAQARSIEGGILHHKQELNAEQVLIIIVYCMHVVCNLRL